MAVNKVIYGNDTLVDLTNDTATENDVLEGATFHDKSGVLKTGRLSVPVKDVQVDGESVVNNQGIAEIDMSGYYTDDEVDTLLAEKADVSDVPVLPTADEQTSTTGEFETVTGGLLSECIVSIEPVQDLHGYSKPWVGGAGKNKLPLVLADIKSLNTRGTWSDNVWTVSGGTVTVTTDLDGYVTGIKINGTFSIDEWFRLATIETLNNEIASGSYILNGCPNDAPTSTYLAIGSSGSDYGSGVSVTAPFTGTNGVIFLPKDKPFNNVAFYPMLRLATESDATFEPYENICPISGHTQADVEVVGKNWAEPIPYRESNSVIFNPLSDGSISVQGTATGYAYSQVLYTLKAGNYIVCNDADVSNTAQLQIRRNSDDQLLLSVNYGQRRELSLESDTGIRLRLVVSSGNTVDAIIYPMIVLSTETDFSFEPYHGKTYSTPFGQTIYGGTLDVVSGVLTIDKAGVDLGTLTWAYHSSSQVFYSADITDESRILAVTCDCEGFKPVENKTAIAQMTEDGTVAFYSGDAYHRTYVKCSLYTDEVAFKSAVSGIKLVYELATPTTIQLTPRQIVSLVGKNYVDAPLNGQSIVEVKFKQLMSIDDIENIVGEIDTGTVITGTLTAGATSVTLSNSKITTNSMIDIYTTVYGLNPTNVTVSNGQIVLTFEAQQSNVGVKVRVS